MLIPKHWAQYKQRFESKAGISNAQKQATIKRYGWSDISQSEALNHAKQRVDDTYQRWLAGEDIVRRERREEYNASNGIPIREQIIFEQTFPKNRLSKENLSKENLSKENLSKENLSLQTQLIVTRNSYGAQVANVDNIAVIDVDNAELLHYLYPEQYDCHGVMSASAIHPAKPATRIQVWIFVLGVVLIASVIAWLELSWLWLLVVMFAATAYLWRQASQKEQALQQKSDDDMASLQPFMTDLIQKRIINHPKESFRLYQTPAGFRIIATHDTVSPSDEVVAEWFAYFHADTNYVRLCQSQQCFRARLTAKPWRMAEVAKPSTLDKSIPTTDFWSMPNNDDIDSDANESRLAELEAREQWINDYDSFAKNYSACRYLESFIGREIMHEDKLAQNAIDEFVQWHDKACQVEKELPLA